MIVYVVTSGEFSDYCIEAVFDNKEQAELYCATRERFCDEKRIEEYDTEEYRFISDKPVFIRWEGQIKEGSYGPYIGKLKAYMTFNKKDGIQENAAYNLKWIIGQVTLNKHSTAEQAKKAILDRYAQWKYEREV